MPNNELSLAGLGIQMPYNMQAEQSVLGAALMDENILTQLITELEADMFYSEQNRAVYTQMAALFAENEAVDVVTLVDALAQEKAMHDELEAIYNPHVDFDRVHARGEEIIENFLALEQA